MSVFAKIVMPFSDYLKSEIWFCTRPGKSVKISTFLRAATFLLFLVLPVFSQISASGRSSYRELIPAISLDSLLTKGARYPTIERSFSTTPNITVRFANPDYDCNNGEYCLDVEFQSDQPDQQLFGMNVRLFYEENTLELVNFRDFQGRYGPVAPNPPTKLTSPPAFGYNYFGFGVPGDGAAEWINGAIQLVDENQPPIFLSTTGWTKLFQICFDVDDPDSISFCPAIVWDLEQNPNNGGYLSGDDGVVMTVYDEATEMTFPASEQVVQFNWNYTGNGSAPPYGAPEPTDCIAFSCGINIVCPDDITVGCGVSTLPSNTGMATSDDHCPGTPIITYSDSIVAGSCGEENYILRTWMVTDSCENQSSCVQIISIDDSGVICGSVFNDLGQPMGGIELRLIKDINMNQTVDPGEIPEATVFSNPVTGAYCFEQVYPCAYVIQEIQPAFFGNLSDFDITPDPDGDDSLDGPDNEIPVLLVSCEADSQNNFIDIVCPLNLPGLPMDTLCENEPVILEITDLNIGLLAYTWDFGSGATPSTGLGLGPHTVSYQSTSENQSSGAHVDLTIAKAGCPDTTFEICLLEINPYPDASINGSTEQGCYYTNRVFQPLQPELPGASYQWNFGVGAVPAFATGYGPHTVYYTSSGSIVVSLAIYPNEPGAQCPDSSTISFNIITCVGQIVGSVKSVYNAPITGVNLRLYADTDTNGIADNSVTIRSVFSNSTGNYSMASVTPGNYVIVQVQPSGWFSVDDVDMTEDGDIVENVDSLDNVIPITIEAGETDGGNYFIEGPIPGTIIGNVFIDANDDQIPDEGEGMPGIVIGIYTDNDFNGIADSSIPVFEQVTSPNGDFAFTDVPIGNYVISQTQPAGYESVIDFDASNDGDVVPNTDMLNDTIPLTLINGETDANNYFIEEMECNLMVTNTNDSGAGSFRHAIECAEDGDTIRFDASLCGATIMITSAEIIIDKQIVIFCNFIPRTTLYSQTQGFFNVLLYGEVEFRGLNIVSGLSGSEGAVFDNHGTVTLCDLQLLRNPLLPFSEFLIYNHPGSLLNVRGGCFFETD